MVQHAIFMLTVLSLIPLHHHSSLCLLQLVPFLPPVSPPFYNLYCYMHYIILFPPPLRALPPLSPLSIFVALHIDKSPTHVSIKI